MPYIKKKKVWTKVFNDSEMKKIWRWFQLNQTNVSGRAIDWKEESYKDLINATEGLVAIYPETDKFDDSEGIQPKQLKRLVEMIGFRATFNLLVWIQESSRVFLNQSQDEDYFGVEQKSGKIIYYKEIVKEFISIPIKEENKAYFGKLLYWKQNGKSFTDAVSLSGITPKGFQRVIEHQYYNYSNEIYENILDKFIESKDVSAMVGSFSSFEMLELYDRGSEITPEMFSIEEYKETQKAKWQKHQKFIPRVEQLLFLDPEWFDRKVFDSVSQRLYKKKFQGLTKDEQNYAIRVYRTLGDLAPLLIGQLREEKIDILSLSDFSLYKGYKLSKGVSRLFNEFNKGIKTRVSLRDKLGIALLVATLPKYDDRLMKTTRFSLDDIESYQSLGSVLANLDQSTREKIMDIDPKLFSDFKKYNISSSKYKAIIELYVATKDLNHTIPLISGDYEGGYKYEILPKSDYRGIIAGDATNCCQTVSSAGRSCVYHGAEHEDSAFFIITDKNDTIICQSWLWVDKEEKILVADSIESVRGSGNFIKIYEKMAKEVIKKSKGIKQVNCGNYRDGFVSSELELSEKRGKVPSIMKTDLPKSTASGMYSDASSRQYVIQVKK